MPPPFFPYGYPPPTPEGFSIKKYRKMQKFMKEFEEEWKKKNDPKSKPKVASLNFLNTLGLMILFGPIVGAGYLIVMNIVMTNLAKALLPH